MSRQPWRCLILALGLLALSAGPVLASDPATERPLTRREIRAAETKWREAQRALVLLDGRQAAATQGLCPEPETSSATLTTGCSVPSGSLPVEARDQIKSIYCGPAVGQVIANYAWRKTAGTNKYGQQKIAGWMGTDTNGGTNAPDLATGLNEATDGAPRTPAGWVWVVIYLVDNDKDGDYADDFYGIVRSNVSVSKMPLAIPVKPHEDGKPHLASWPNPVQSVGHWIAGYAWRDRYDGTLLARIWYTDSSRDEGGATGKFSDPVKRITHMIRNHTNRVVW